MLQIDYLKKTGMNHGNLRVPPQCHRPRESKAWLGDYWRCLYNNLCIGPFSWGGWYWQGTRRFPCLKFNPPKKITVETIGPMHPGDFLWQPAVCCHPKWATKQSSCLTGWLIGILFKNWLIIITIYLGSISSPIYPKQPGALVLLLKCLGFEQQKPWHRFLLFGFQVLKIGSCHPGGNANPGG